MQLRVKDKENAPIMIYIDGEALKNLEIVEAYYINDSDRIVSEKTLDYIWSKYYNGIEEAFINEQACIADIRYQEAKEEGII